jgi:hypothetical protein
MKLEMTKANMIIKIILTLSLGANILLFAGLAHDEGQIRRVNAEIQEHNRQVALQLATYRGELMQMKKDHPILFHNLQIPPEAK